MTKNFVFVIGFVSLLVLAHSSWAADFEFLEKGYQTQTFAQKSQGGLDFLPNGDLVGFDGRFVFLIDANGDGLPVDRENIFDTGAQLFGTFLKVSPQGDRILFGESSRGDVYSMMAEPPYTGEILRSIPFHFDAVFHDNDHVVISATLEGFASQPDNKILYWDLVENRLATILTIGGASGPVALDDANNLYYIQSTYVFPAPPNSNRLLKFTNDLFLSVIQGGAVLQPSDGREIATLDSGFNIEMNAFGDMFVTDFFGFIHRIHPDGTRSLFAKTNNGLGLYGVLAFYRKNHFFRPYGKSEARLAVYFDDFDSNQNVLLIQTQPDDPFADTVLDYQPGSGTAVDNPEFNDPNRALGPPVGGGTAQADNSSQVTLGDGGTLTLGFHAPIRDDAQNLDGSDLIVFGNAFFITGDPTRRWTEPAFVEVSQDLNHNGEPDDPWFLILPDILPEDLTIFPDADYLRLPLQHYADFTPTLMLGDLNANDVNDTGDQPEIDPALFYTVPDDSVDVSDSTTFRIRLGSGGGDAFDLRRAVVQTAPGVPLKDDFGAPRFVFLDQIDFLRVHDAVLGDMSFGAPIDAEVDAVSDARAQIHGRTLFVDHAANGGGDGSKDNPFLSISLAMAAAAAGDTICVSPGEYFPLDTIMLKPGVSLVGATSGLWTPNDPTDDVVLNGRDLVSSTGAFTGALIQLHDESVDPSFVSKQGTTIRGFIFRNSKIGVFMEGFAPTIEENIFEGCFVSIFISSAHEEVLLRHNILGQYSEHVLAGTGIYVEDSTIALVHNTVTFYEGTAIFSHNTQVYLRDNIFAFNGIIFEEIGNGSLYAHFNNTFDNASSYDFVIGQVEDEILGDPMLVSLADYRLALESSVRGQGLGGGDPGVYDGAAFIPLNSVHPVDMTAPETPQGLSLTDIGEQVRVSWQANDDADLAGYRLYRLEAPQQDLEFLVELDAAQTEYVDSGVVANATYRYAITAIDDRGNESNFSNQETIVVQGPSLPEAPQGLDATQDNQDIVLSWDAVSGEAIVGYHVYRAEASEGTYTRLNQGVVAETDFRDDRIVPGTKGFYAVTSVNGQDQESEFSAEVMQEAADLRPNRVSNFQAEQVGSVIRLTWEAPSDRDVARYQIMRYAFGSGLTEYSATETHVESDIVPRRRFHLFWVRAVDDAGHRSSVSFRFIFIQKTDVAVLEFSFDETQGRMHVRMINQGMVATGEFEAALRNRSFFPFRSMTIERMTIDNLEPGETRDWDIPLTLETGLNHVRVLLDSQWQLDEHNTRNNKRSRFVFN